jgi:glyoxylase-like metal-dependent hydrolase (beta-lactamase superfamily II)
MPRNLPLLVAVAITACGGSPPDPGNPDDAARMGREIIEHALDETGRPAELAGGRAFVFYGTGTLDKAAEGQAFATDHPSPGPFRERLAFDLTGRRLAREYREDRYDGTFEHLTEIHGADSILTYVVHSLGFAVPGRSASNPAAAQATRRRLPHALLTEISRDGATPRWLGSDGGVERVAALLESGTEVTLAFDPSDRLLRSLAYDTVLTGHGRVSIAWNWSDWRTVPELGRFPFRYGATVDGKPYIDVFVDSVTLAREAHFSVPAGMRTLPVQFDSARPPASLDVRQVAAGVFVVPNVRSGFAPLVIERANDIVVVDAPASYPLLASIPLSQTDPGPASGWVSERFARTIRQRFPQKPIAFAILTHAHEDHAAGVRAFVAEGATVVGHPSIRRRIEAWLHAPADTTSDGNGANETPLQFMEVTDSLTLDDAIRPIRLLRISPNPHAEALLAVHVPGPDILFISDLVTPGPIDSYPRAAHASLDLAFIRWFTGAGFRSPRILSMHGSGELTPAHIARLRQLLANRDSLSGL